MKLNKPIQFIDTSSINLSRIEHGKMVKDWLSTVWWRQKTNTIHVFIKLAYLSRVYYVFFILWWPFCSVLFCLTFTWYLGTCSNVCLNFLSIVPAAVFIFTYFFISTNTFFLPWLLPAKQSHGLDATPLTNWLSHWLTSNWRDKNKNVPDQTRPWTPKLLQILNPLKSED